jgi:nucleotide-binding universal stress UspA family protein
MVTRSLVLVAIDRATAVERTVGVALRIAKQDGIEVHALHVLPGQGAAYVPDRNAPPWVTQSDGESGMNSRLAALRQSAGREGVTLRVVTLGGSPAHVIPAYAQLHKASLLVVERDYGSWRFWRHARVVGQLARRSPMPLLVLPPARRTVEARPVAGLRRILTPVDFSIASAVAMRTARELASRHGAGLILLHAMDDVPRHMVYSGSEAWRVMQRLPARARTVAERLQRKAATFGAGDVTAQVVTGDPDRAIVAAAAQNDADLVVMGVAPRSWLDRLVFGSTLPAVLRRANVPVLVVPVIGGDHEWHEPAS